MTKAGSPWGGIPTATRLLAVSFLSDPCATTSLLFLPRPLARVLASSITAWFFFSATAKYGLVPVAAASSLKVAGGDHANSHRSVKGLS